MKATVILMMSAALCVASCSDNDDNDEMGNAIDVAGSYEGYTVASSRMFQNMVTPDEKLTIANTGAGLANVSFNSESWGNIAIDNTTVTVTDNGCTITGNGTAVMGMGDTRKDYPCALSGRIVNHQASMEFTCPQVMGGLKIEFRQGDIPASLVLPGNYAGYTRASFQYAPDGMLADAQTISITDAGNGKFKVSYISDSWGEFTIPEATATYGNGAFRLSGSGTTKMGMNGNVSEYQCQLEGIVDVTKENPSFTFKVPAVMGGLTIEFFPGSAPAE